MTTNNKEEFYHEVRTCGSTRSLTRRRTEKKLMKSLRATPWITQCHSVV